MTSLLNNLPAADNITNMTDPPDMVEDKESGNLVNIY